MLDGLDEAKFAKASHAYGKAKDVPELLRALVSKSDKERADALFKLGSAICHQGTLYSATALTVPYLLELIASPKVKDRADILQLLADIVTLDDHGRYLLDGYPPSPPSDLPAAFRKAIVAVREASEVVLPLLAEKETAVRHAAAFLLAWLPRANAEAVAEAFSAEEDAAVRASLALTLGLLGRAPALAKDTKGVALKTAVALATSNANKGDIDDETRRLIETAAGKKSLKVEGMHFVGGDLATFAVEVLAALGGDLTPAIEAGGNASVFAANVVVRSKFDVKGPPPKENYQAERRDKEQQAILAALPVKLADLDAEQRRIVNALAKLDGGYDNDLSTALGERGLPPKKELMVMWLAGVTKSAASILDREVKANGKATTLGELYLRATREYEPDAAVVDAIEAATTVDERLALALEGLALVEVSWSMAVAYELLWRNAPKASKASLAAILKLPKKHGDAVAVGVALAARALASKKPADESVDKLLQETHGFWPAVKRALAALPEPRREKWVLSKKRDDQAQPAEFFTGAWQYFGACPTKKIADRALAHIATWKPKDPWGEPRKLYADPRLKELIADFRSAGNTADAKRLEQALASLK